MTAVEIITQLRAQGVKLQVRGDRLRYAPASAVTPELREQMAEHKQEVLAILCQTCLTCGEALKITETDRYREVRCPAEPVHYFRLESKRPGQPAGIFASETVSQV